jgi:hypothetical protein
MDPEQIPLRDLHLPEAVGWWPLAPGWWVLIALAVIALAFAVRGWWRVRARGAARRFALRQLKDIEREFEQHKNPVAFGANLSALLRRTMLAYAPRQDVAGLTGEAWLEWLDQGLAKPLFSNGPGRQIVELPYKNPDAALRAADVDRLLAAVRHRVATPLGGKR